MGAPRCSVWGGRGGGCGGHRWALRHLPEREVRTATPGISAGTPLCSRIVVSFPSCRHEVPQFPLREGWRRFARAKRAPSLLARNQNGRPAPSRYVSRCGPHSRWRRPRFRRAFARSQDGGRKARVNGGAGAAPPAPKMAAVAMRLPVIRKAVGPSGPRGGEKHLVVPGDTITTDTGYMRWGRQRWGDGAGRPWALLLRPFCLQGPRHVRGRGEARRLGRRCCGEGEQAGVRHAAEDQVSPGPGCPRGLGKGLCGGWGKGCVTLCSVPPPDITARSETSWSGGSRR